MSRREAGGQLIKTTTSKRERYWEGIFRQNQVVFFNTTRTRLADPTVADHRLLNHARSILQANPAGACVVSLLASALWLCWRPAPTDIRQPQFPTQVHNKTRNRCPFSRRDAKPDSANFPIFSNALPIRSERPVWIFNQPAQIKTPVCGGRCEAGSGGPDRGISGPNSPPGDGRTESAVPDD